MTQHEKRPRPYDNSRRQADTYERYFDIAHTLLWYQEFRIGYKRPMCALKYAMKMEGVGKDTVYSAIHHSSECWFPTDTIIRQK
jgi:hypothetical protein